MEAPAGLLDRSLHPALPLCRLEGEPARHREKYPGIIRAAARAVGVDGNPVFHLSRISSLRTTSSASDTGNFSVTQFPVGFNISRCGF